MILADISKNEDNGDESGKKEDELTVFNLDKRPWIEAKVRVESMDDSEDSDSSSSDKEDEEEDKVNKSDALMYRKIS